MGPEDIEFGGEEVNLQMEAEEQQVGNQALSGGVGCERVYCGEAEKVCCTLGNPKRFQLKGIDCPLRQLTPSHGFQSIKQEH